MEALVILLLALVNGIFAMTEIAFVSVKRTQLKQLRDRGSNRARTVLALLSKPEKFLSTVQVAISAVAIIAGAYGGANLADTFSGLFESSGFTPESAARISMVLVVGGIAFVTILIGELVPKTIAMRHALGIALTMVPFMHVLAMILYPFVWILMQSTRLILRMFGFKKDVEDRLTEDELRLIIKTAGKQGILGRDENLMHENLFNFAEATAVHIMTPRHEVEWINMRDPLTMSAEIMDKSVHSKFPLCDGSIDKVKGIVHSHRFFQHYADDSFSWQNIVSEPIYFPVHMPAIKILNAFRKRKEYFAVIIDEYGNFEGIISLHDLMEGIVGNLPSLDEDDHDLSVRENGTLLVSGSCKIKTLNSGPLGNIAPENTAAYQTVAGYLMHQLKRLPVTGELVDLHGFRFEIVDLDGSRIDKVIIATLDGKTETSSGEPEH